MFSYVFIKRQLRHAVLVSLLLIIIITTVVYHTPNAIEIHDKVDNLSCILSKANNALLSFGNPTFVVSNSCVFFHETSCKGYLNSRQACGVEAAARTHPRWSVYVLFSNSVVKSVFKQSTFAVLAKFDNIKFERIHIKEYASGSAFEALVQTELIKSVYPVEHASDILRFLTMLKYGGIYLDFDIIVIKPLDTLPENWFAKESSELIASGLMRFSKDGIGRKFSEAIIREINNTFRPYDWAYNGPEVVTRVFKRICKNDITALSNSNCRGFTIFDSNNFYPIHYSRSSYYFEAGDLENHDAYTHHMWNQITKNKPIRNDSRYAKLAKKYCPTIYNTFGDYFGADIT